MFLPARARSGATALFAVCVALLAASLVVPTLPDQEPGPILARAGAAGAKDGEKSAYKDLHSSSYRGYGSAASRMRTSAWLGPLPVMRSKSVYERLTVPESMVWTGTMNPISATATHAQKQTIATFFCSGVFSPPIDSPSEGQ